MQVNSFVVLPQVNSFVVLLQVNSFVVLLQVNSFVGAFHDAVILYALALNETLEAGGSVRDGVTITRRMWNRTFQGTYSIHHHPAHVELHVHC